MIKASNLGFLWRNCGNQPMEGKGRKDLRFKLQERKRGEKGRETEDFRGGDAFNGRN